MTVTQKDLQRLRGLRVCMLVSNNLAIDARVRKEAETLAYAGAEVIVFGLGHEYPPDIMEDAPYRLILAQPNLRGKPIVPRLGREDVCYPLRVLVNKTITHSRHRRYLAKSKAYGISLQAARQEMIEAARPYTFDIVHAHDLDTLYAAYHIAQANGALLVYDAHELYLALHFLVPDIKEQLARVERDFFPAIDALVTVSPAIGKRLCEIYGRTDLTPVVLYNGGTRVAGRTRPVHDPVRLFFQGAFAADRNLLELVAAMDTLRGRATLTLQGWGQDAEAIQHLITQMALQQTVKVIPPVAPFEVVAAAEDYDVGIINSLAKDENFLVTLPNKLFDYMCAGLAIASSNLPPIAEIVQKESCGIVYEQKGVEHTAQVLGDLVADREQIMRMKEASLAAAGQYAWARQAEKLVDLYGDLKHRHEAKQGRDATK
ncbi:MAG: glycosyltransferase family 4 protein [Coriobacteriia bacterium]|nr:glycosyltransferase family 4 protein [Coriobacteriia bacterium]